VWRLAVKRKKRSLSWCASTGSFIPLASFQSMAPAGRYLSERQNIDSAFIVHCGSLGGRPGKPSATVSVRAKCRSACEVRGEPRANRAGVRWLLAQST
jgi:hypothetical protein